MTSKEFVLWLKGFTEGVHEFNVTPKQWDLLKDKLAEVDDNTIPMGGVIVDHNTFKVNDHGFYQMPSHQYGTGNTQGVITTTPRGGSITYATPPFTTTSTAYGYPSGSTISYTNSTWQPEHGPNSPKVQNINESLEDLEKQFWAEQPPEPFATPEELAKYNIDAV